MLKVIIAGFAFRKNLFLTQGLVCLVILEISNLLHLYKKKKKERKKDANTHLRIVVKDK